MLQSVLKLLKAEWKTLLLILVLTGSGIWFGTFISAGALATQSAAFATEKQTLTDEFSRKELQWEKERTDAAGRFATQLQAALTQRDEWQRKSDGLTVELAEKKNNREKKVSDLQERKENALKNDGIGYTGIGPAGLQLWREALGYPGANSVPAGHGMSEASGGTAAGAGDAARPGRGLSAGGIISHSAEYGQWCLTLRDRLQALNDYYR